MNPFKKPENTYSKPESTNSKYTLFTDYQELNAFKNCIHKPTIKF